MDTNPNNHERWLWFTSVNGIPAEVERCDDDDCESCAQADPVVLTAMTLAA
jgi:hypothetical protein